MDATGTRGHDRRVGIGANDILGVLNEADSHGELGAWSEAFEQGVSRAAGAVDTALIRVRAGGERIELLLPRERPALARVMAAGHGSLGDRDRELLYRRGPTAVALSELFPRGTRDGTVEAAMDDLGAADIVGLVGEPDLSIMVLTDRVQSLDTRQRQLLLGLVQHAAASVALRDTDGATGLLDHELPVRLRGALAELDRRREGATSGSTDAESALAFLARLASEGFAVVKEERRGRRHRLVAVRVRDPSARSLRSLDAGERRVLEGLRRGLSLQEIGYELRIAEATVAGRIRRIRAKLGIDPRSDVVRAAAAHER